MGEKITCSDKPWLENYKLGPYPLKKSMEPYPEEPVYMLLERAADEYPGNTAILFMENEMTYKELLLHSNKLAAALADFGVEKGDKVATVLPNCPQFAISDYAILKAGAAHVPCSFLEGKDELERQMGEAEVETVVCMEESLDLIKSIKKDTKIENVVVTSPEDYAVEGEPTEVSDAHNFLGLIERYEPEPPEVEIDSKEDLAQLSFTGGTTGRPKGVMLTHFNVVANVRQGTEWYLSPLEPGIKGKGSVLLPLPVFHNFGHYILHSAVNWALRLILVPDPRDIDTIAQLLKKHRPIMTAGVPTHFMQLLSKDIERMQALFVSGAAALPPDVAKKVEEKIGTPMGEGYGMTEAYACTHINLSGMSKLTRFVEEVKFGCIGVPVPDTEVKIVDLDTGDECSVGEPGELYVRGPQIMKGYWPTPGKGLEDGWLPTGDVAKMDEDGDFFIVDRVKDMANVSGMKVYTREVDDMLMEHPGIYRAATIGVPDPERPGSERIKVFIERDRYYEGELTEEDVIDYCKENLAPYAVPKFVEFREDLPLTDVGKVDKKVLESEESES